MKSLSRVRLFATPWTVAHQAPLSVEFSRWEYWSGLPFASPGDLPNPGIKLGSPALRADAIPSEPPGKVPGIFKGLASYLYLCPSVHDPSHSCSMWLLGRDPFHPFTLFPLGDPNSDFAVSNFFLSNWPLDMFPRPYFLQVREPFTASQGGLSFMTLKFLPVDLLQLFLDLGCICHLLSIPYSLI